MFNTYSISISFFLCVTVSKDMITALSHSGALCVFVLSREQTKDFSRHVINAK